MAFSSSSSSSSSMIFLALIVVSQCLVFSGLVHAKPVDIACIKDISLASAEIADAADQIALASKVCGGNTSAQCSAAISGAIADLSTATADITRAIQDCGGGNTTCATDLANVAADLAGATEAISNAV